MAEAEVWNQPLCETSGSRFKPSRFNAHVLEPDGSLLLYNSFTGSRCIIPARGAAAAQSYVSAQGSDGPLDELGTYLHTKGYLVEESVDEMARLAYRASLQQFRTDTLQLFLLSAEECNFRCVYCSQQFKRGLMAPDIRHGVRSLVEARIGKLGSLDISWFGGEPMLGFEVIEDLAPYLQDLARRHGVAFSSHITTNGYLLTPARSAQMVEWGISSYQITVDGDAAEHDRHRPLREGGATFQTILENVLAMRELPGPFLVRLRVNFDHSNLPMVAPLLERLRNAIGRDRRFLISFFPVGKWGGPHDDQLDVCTGMEAFDAEAGLRQAAREAGLAPEPLGERLRPVPANICYAARPYSLIIGADGKIMKCTVALDTLDQNVVGRLRRDGTLEINSDRMAAWVRPYYENDSTCRTCFFVPVCQGVVCPLPRVTGGDRPCPPAKVAIQRTLRETAREPGCGSDSLVNINVVRRPDRASAESVMPTS